MLLVDFDLVFSNRTLAARASTRANQRRYSASNCVLEQVGISSMYCAFVVCWPVTTTPSHEVLFPHLKVLTAITGTASRGLRSGGYHEQAVEIQLAQTKR